MSPEENNAVAVRFFDEAWNKGNLGIVDELTLPDAVDHSGVGGPEKGGNSFKFIVNMFRTAMPDCHLTIEDAIYTGDRVVHRWSLAGTHQAPLMGIPATGKPLALTGTTIVRFADGKIAERWANVDELGLLRQLGVVPPPPGQN